MKYIIEHMEDEIFPWCKLEYSHMAETVGSENLIFTNLKEGDVDHMPANIKKENCYTKSVVELGIPIEKICLLDQEASSVMQTTDDKEYEYLLFGGILGDEETIAMECLVPDRTSELRKFNFPTRHLGTAQMTTDGAVLVSKIIVEDKVKFEDIEFVDHPEIKLGKMDSTIMPFRYVKNSATGQPRMAPGMIDLLKEDQFEF